MELIAALDGIVRRTPHSTITLRNAHLGASGGVALSEALRTAMPDMLATVDLYGCDISITGADAVAHALVDRGGCTALDLGANTLDDRFGASLAPLLWERLPMEDSAQAVKEPAGLRELRLARNRLGGQACTAMFTLPPTAPDHAQLLLTSLALSFNPLGAAGGAAIGRVLAADRMPTVRSLQLQGCELGTEGVTSLAENLGYARALLHLDLTDNRMGADGAAAVAASLPPTLEELLLARNAIGDRGATTLATALVRKRKCVLRTLVLASNGLRDAAAVALAEALGAPRPRGNRSLEHLDLSANKLRAGAALALGDALVVNSSLLEVKLQRNRHLDAAALKAISGLVAHNRAQACGGDFERIAPSEQASRLAPLGTQRLFTADIAAARLLGQTPRDAPSASAAASVALESEALMAASSALGELQHALGEAGHKVARLRHKEAMLRHALHAEGVAPGA